MTPRTALGWRTCETCGHEFRREASEVDGRVLWFHYGTEAVGPKGDAALCRCGDCQRWCPPLPRFGPVGGDRTGAGTLRATEPPALPSGTKVDYSTFPPTAYLPRFPAVEGEPVEVPS